MVLTEYGLNGVEPAGSNIGDLYDIRFSPIYGAIEYANPSNTYSGGGYWYSQSGVWQSIGSIPRVVGSIGAQVVIKIEIRRRSDFVVVSVTDTTFTVTSAATSPTPGEF